MVAMNLLLISLLSLTSATPSPSWTAKLQSLGPSLKSMIPQSGPITPQILGTLLQPIQTNIARNSYVYRSGTSLMLLDEPWIANGANVYWLGLDENVIPPPGEPFYAPFNASYPTKGRITEAMATLATMGAKLIRSQTLGVSTGNPLSLMPAPGKWNEEAFESMDWAVWQARQHGLRIFAPLTDNYDYYHGGKFNFLRWAGFNITGSTSPLPADTLQFYTNGTIIASFKEYITKLMTHVNPYTGISYAADPTIIGYETGNELGGIKFGDKNVDVAWTREICQLMKKLGPHKLCIDGTYGINTTHFSISEIDIFDDHFYPLNNTKLTTGITQVESTDRVYIAGEIDWTGVYGGDSLESFYGIIEERQNRTKPTVAGSLFWSLFGRDVPDCGRFVNHTDGFSLQYNNPLNTAKNNTQISTIRQHYFAMQGIKVDAYLPSVACPRDFVPGYEAEYTYY